jgi:hypothetical protein
MGQQDETMSEARSKEEDIRAERAASSEHYSPNAQAASFKKYMEQNYGSTRGASEVPMSETGKQYAALEAAGQEFAEKLSFVNELRDIADSTSGSIAKELRQLADERAGKAQKTYLEKTIWEREQLALRQIAVERIRAQNDAGFRKLGELVNAYKDELLGKGSMLTQAERSEAVSLLDMTYTAESALRAPVQRYVDQRREYERERSRQLYEREKQSIASLPARKAAMEAEKLQAERSRSRSMLEKARTKQSEAHETSVRARSESLADEKKAAEAAKRAAWTESARKADKEVKEAAERRQREEQTKQILERLRANVQKKEDAPTDISPATLAEQAGAKRRGMREWEDVQDDEMTLEDADTESIDIPTITRRAADTKKPANKNGKANGGSAA